MAWVDLVQGYVWVGVATVQPEMGSFLGVRRYQTASQTRKNKFYK